MITGYNTDIKHRGQTYHVQTEDKGMNNPKVETLVYRGGAILATHRTSYADVLNVDCLEEVITRLMEEQHQKIINDIKAGKFDTEKDEAFATDLISDKSLDEVIMDYLSSSEPPEDSQ